MKTRFVRSGRFIDESKGAEHGIVQLSTLSTTNPKFLLPR